MTTKKTYNLHKNNIKEVQTRKMWHTMSIIAGEVCKMGRRLKD